jgi:hypothetical protein
MKLELTPQEKQRLLEICFASLQECVNMWGLHVVHSNGSYQSSKQHILSEIVNEKGMETSYRPCYEEILAQLIVDGHTLKFIDFKEGENSLTYAEFDINKFYENFNNCNPIHIVKILSFDYTTNDVDEVLQTLIFGSVHYE